MVANNVSAVVVSLKLGQHVKSKTRALKCDLAMRCSRPCMELVRTRGCSCSCSCRYLPAAYHSGQSGTAGTVQHVGRSRAEITAVASNGP